jgi:acetyl-CoA carboxylase biotin carboxylase subunit
VETEAEATKVAKKIGFPVIIKAVAGGGGKGMRIVRNAVALGKEYNTAKNEAEKAFGDGRLYLEKYIENPRHIEFQILADQHGKILHIGERDCSVQRRHQKLIEEAPSPFLTPDLRRRMGQAAVRAAAACGYQNAGTVEFLVDKKGEFYFMEMNTRIQVEHGVTEEAYDLDLVRWQLRIAQGEKLDFDQKDVQLKRCAIEARVNAENPARNFAPCPGTVTLHYPPGGIGIRVDTHVYGGYKIPPNYDSMISKVIAYGPDRKTALERMHRALGEYLIHGIETTIPFSRAIMADPIFRQGQATTAFVEDFMRRTPVEAYSGKV